MENKTVHLGHRDRMINKVYSSPDSLLDHEILEVLLYSFIPRIDTNPIAHNLLRTFGSLYGVFHASTKELAFVDGVGEKTASMIALVGKVIDIASIKNKKPSKTSLNSFEKVRNELKNYFALSKVEKFVVALLDKKYDKLVYLDFITNDPNVISVEVSDVAKAIAIHKPKYAVIAHNHPSDNVEPSSIDDFTTKKVNLLCSIHNVELIDHVIFRDGEVYSYRNNHRMDFIKETANLDKLIDGIK